MIKRIVATNMVEKLCPLMRRLFEYAYHQLKLVLCDGHGLNNVGLFSLCL